MEVIESTLRELQEREWLERGIQLGESYTVALELFSLDKRQNNMNLHKWLELLFGFRI